MKFNWSVHSLAKVYIYFISGIYLPAGAFYTRGLEHRLYSPYTTGVKLSMNILQCCALSPSPNSYTLYVKLNLTIGLSVITI